MNVLAAFFPGKLWVYLAVVGVVFAAGGTGAWQLQEMRYGNIEKERVQAQLVAEREFAQNESKRQQNTVDALNTARTREAGLRADASAARDATNRLHNATDAAIARAKTSNEACLISATSLGDVFQRCSNEYRKLGEISDRHVSDIQTLNESWPK